MASSFESVAVQEVVAKMRADLAVIGANRPDDLIAVVWERLGTLLDAPNRWLTIGCKDEAVPLGWYPFVAAFSSGRPGHRQIIKEWFTERDVASCPSIVACFAEVGRVRALRPRVRMSADQWHGCITRADLTAMGLRDRLTGACPINDQVEVFLGFDRDSAGDDFSADDEVTLQRALVSLSHVCRLIALSYGAIPHGNLLSRRERGVLLGLLAGNAEKQVASDIGLTLGSTHQVVVRLYRKFRVQSRPELMALWLQPESNQDSPDTHLADVNNFPWG